MADEISTAERNDTFEIVGFAGSLRRGSYNRALLRAATREAPSGMRIEEFDISDIPLYNADVEEEGAPEAVVRFKEAVGRADGLLIATPEYNHAVPAVTKNVIDWASRPASSSVLINKPVGLMGASRGQWGTARGQTALRSSFAFTASIAMLQPQMLVPKAAEKFDAEGALIDEQTREYLRRFLEGFEDWVRMLQAGFAAIGKEVGRP
ncbi:MAG TPA: NADPH-dependent FMN reductase [Thermoleophilia bacterium]|nr:NADPH-dependent FMN reductase [Thermoleophilia bacterium]